MAEQVKVLSTGDIFRIIELRSPPASPDSLDMDTESPLLMAPSYYNDIADHSPIPYRLAPIHSGARRRLQFDYFEGSQGIPKLAIPKDVATVRFDKPSGVAPDVRQQIMERKRESLEEPSPLVFEAVSCSSCCLVRPPPHKCHKRAPNEQQFMIYTCSICSKTYANFYLETI